MQNLDAKIESLIDTVVKRENIQAANDLLNQLTMARRVREYLWQRLLEAQTPVARSWYFNGYVEVYRAQYPPDQPERFR
jgi:hypothetical protein